MVVFMATQTVWAQQICSIGAAGQTLQTSSTGTLRLVGTPPITVASVFSPPTAFVRSTPTNLVANGDFEIFGAVATVGTFNAVRIAPNAVLGAYPAVPALSSVPSWQVTGGNSTTYIWHGKDSNLLGSTPTTALGANALTKGYIYMGASAQNYQVGGVYYPSTNITPATSPLGRVTLSGAVTVGPNNFVWYVNNPSTGAPYAFPVAPIAIEQTVTLVAGNDYRMTFYVVGEATKPPGDSTYTQIDGFVGLDISGYSREHLLVPSTLNAETPGRGRYYTLQFTAKQAATTIRFTSYGHGSVVNNVSTGALSLSTEPVIDDVMINRCETVRVSGTVFNDVNGLTDSIVNGTGTGQPAGAQLFANLIGLDGNVIATTPVSTGGTYTFANAPANSALAVQVSTNAGVTGSAAPAAALPANWVPTGEFIGTTAGNDGTVDQRTTVTTVITDIPNVNFGIEQLPSAGNITAPTAVNPGGAFNIPVLASLFSGSDPDGGTVTSITITAIPVGATRITINGVVFNATNPMPPGGVTVPAPGGVPAQPISVNPTSSGNVTLTIIYTTTDNAGKTSTAPGSVVLPFTTPPINACLAKPAANQLPSGFYTTAAPGVALPQTLTGVVSVAGDVTLIPSGFSTPTPLSNVGYQWGISNAQFRPLATPNIPSIPSAGSPGPWAFQTRNTSAVLATDATYTTVFDFTAGAKKPKGMSFQLSDVDNGVDLATVRVFSGGSLVTYTYSLAGGATSFVRVMSGTPALAGPYTNPASGTALSFNGTASSNAQNDLDTFYDGVVTITPDPTKVIDRIEFVRNMFAGAASGSASMSIGNFCWITTEGVNVSGNVFNDVNGLTDSTVNGTGTNAGSPSLTAYLIDNAGNIAKSTSVSASGTYTFSTILAGTYTVVLSNTAGFAIGAAAPAASTPATWINTGENNAAAAGSDGLVNGKSAPFLVSNTSDTTNINFGIAQAANLTVSKTNGTTTLAAGTTSNYTLTVSNLGPADASGAVVRDIPGAGLSNCSVISCAPVGLPAATCPAVLANLLTPGGALIPSLPAGSSLSFVVRCAVSATGL